MKLLNTGILIAILGLALSCADDEAVEEPVSKSIDEEDVSEDALGDIEENMEQGAVELEDSEIFDEGDAGADDYAGEPEPVENEESTMEDDMGGAAPSAPPPPKPMKKGDETGGGIISGGAKPKTEGGQTLDCKKDKSLNKFKGLVGLGCYVMENGTRTKTLKGRWNVFNGDDRIRIKKLEFAASGYDVIFYVSSSDADLPLSFRKNQ